MSNQSLPVTHTSTVTPEQIDELGHMNVRWYGANAVAATEKLCSQFDVDPATLTRTYTRHYNEQLEGSELEVRSGVLEGDRLRFFHELRNRENADLAATFVHELKHPRVEMPAIQIPDYGHPRSLDLSIDRLKSTPTLQELRSRGLAKRTERQVNLDDSKGADVVPMWLAPNLVWGGELSGDDSWIESTADGDQVAFASMETLFHTARPVAVGTRIQSFSAVIALGERITHELSWVYDLDTEQPLAVAETIDLAFSIPNRRSREIPAEIREREAQRLHPDLAG